MSELKKMNIPVDVTTDSSIFESVIADLNYFAFEVSYQLPPYSPEETRTTSHFGSSSAKVGNYPQPTAPHRGGMSMQQMNSTGGVSATAGQVEN